MPHIIVPEAEEILDKEFKVLDHGFVRLVDYMGSDQRIVDAARVSYQAGTKKINSDRGLIRYLLRHKHTTPLEKVRFEFHIKLPIFVMRQLIRHRMASVNEESARYSVLSDEFYIPQHLRKQSVTNKQGSSDEIISKLCHLEDRVAQKGESIAPLVDVEEYLNRLCENAYGEYEYLLSNGVARELARMVLPVNIYTQFYWTIDLHNLMHFLKLRLDSHAQLEIQEFAKPIEMCARAVCPIAMEAWTDYIYDAVNFSRMEVGVIRSIVQNLGVMSQDGREAMLELLAKGSGMETRTDKGEYSREFKEFLDKLGINNVTHLQHSIQQSAG